MGETRSTGGWDKVDRWGSKVNRWVGQGQQVGGTRSTGGVARSTGGWDKVNRWVGQGRQVG